MFDQSFWLGTLAFILFYFWFVSIKLHSFFNEAKSVIFFIFISLVFAFLAFTIFFIAFDTYTTNADKDYLMFKQDIYLKVFTLLEILLLFVLPYFYCFYYCDFPSFLVNSKNCAELGKNKESISISKSYVIRREMKLRIYFILFGGIMLILNLFYFMLVNYIYFKSETGFSSNVPAALAENAVLRSDFERLVFFNFSIIMIIGKLVAFTYLPFGMAKYVSSLLFEEADTLPKTKPVSKKGLRRDIYTNTSKTLADESSSKVDSSFHKIIIKKSDNSQENPHFNLSKRYNKEKSIDYKLNCDSIFEVSTKLKLDPKSFSEDQDEAESFTNSSILNSSHLSTLRKNDEVRLKKNKRLKTDDKSWLALTYTFISKLWNLVYTLLCIFLLVSIIETKTCLVFTKLFHNICGIDCGLLTYRYEKLYTLETLLKFLKKNTESSFLQLDFVFFCMIFSFRIQTVYKALTVKGVAFLTYTFYKIEKDISKQQIIFAVWTILFVGIVIIFDINYLLPEYMRFNGLPSHCDYTLINESECGISYIGLMLIKLSMNFHILMYYDVIATFVFVVSGMFWSYRLIISPAYNKLIHFAMRER